ncbi:p53-like transcription factor, partial [Martensiomyces pterosporus]
MPLIQRRRTLPQGSRLESDPFFVEAVQYQQLLSMDRANKYTVRLFPQVDRGFFLSDNDWTCYRRNYFQVSSTFSLIGTNAPVSDPECPCIVVENETMHTVVRFLVGISAQISNSDKKIELVQHTPKRDKGPQTTPHPQPVRASGSMHASAIGINSSTACFERLQFKTATANNGKRRAAQQYYVLIVELLAECDDGSRILVAASASSPIVVRGRSPGHYADGSNRRSTASSSHTSKMTPSYS